MAKLKIAYAINGALAVSMYFKKRKGLKKMKKLFNFIWSKKQTETPKWTFENNASEPSRDRYNKIHGLGKTLI